MKAGQLRYLIEIWRKTATTSEFNEEVEDYKMLRKCRADVVWKIGKTEILAESEINRQNVELRLRKYVDVVITDRIVLDGVTYEVISTVPDERLQMKVIIAEVVNK